MRGTERLLRELRSTLGDAGLSASVLVRDLRTGDEIGLDPDAEYPAASLVKVALAMATFDRIERGELDGATALELEPGRITTPGPVGVSRFRHPARIAIDDLVYLSTSLSDGSAADALFALTPPAEVTAALHGWGLTGIAVRGTTSDLNATPAERFGRGDAHLAQALAIGAGTAGGGHGVHQLDVTRASSGSARAFIDLLASLWTPSPVSPFVSAQVRALLGANVLRHRLTPDFASDASVWSSKTGTVLNLRHEIGVVEHANGDVFAVAVLTASSVAATLQPEAEATMGQVARRLHDELRLR
jgi:beta-lactamase class A